MALMAIHEAIGGDLRRRNPRVVRDARQILESLPIDSVAEDWRRQLLQRLEPPSPANP
jgi:hypothetical protein